MEEVVSLDSSPGRGVLVYMLRLLSYDFFDRSFGGIISFRGSMSTDLPSGKITRKREAPI